MIEMISGEGPEPAGNDICNRHNSDLLIFLTKTVREIWLLRILKRITIGKNAEDKRRTRKA